MWMPVPGGFVSDLSIVLGVWGWGRPVCPCSWGFEDKKGGRSRAWHGRRSPPAPQGAPTLDVQKCGTSVWSFGPGLSIGAGLWGLTMSLAEARRSFKERGSRGNTSPWRLAAGGPLHATPTSCRQLYGNRLELRCQAIEFVKTHALRMSCCRVLWTSRGNEEEQGGPKSGRASSRSRP
jgi:hypothetical protein